MSNIKTPYKLAYIVSHPIQYQAPLLKLISEQDDISLSVFFLCKPNTKKYVDPGFNQTITWDKPLLEGYQHEFIDSTLKSGEFDFTNPKVSLASLRTALNSNKWDAVWIHGYAHFASLYTVYYCWKHDIPLMLRGDSTLLSSRKSWIRTLLSRCLFKRCAALLCVGNDNRDYYLHYGANPESLFLMPYAVDNAFFRQAATSQLESSTDKRVILYASKFIQRKHPLMLIKAFHKLAPKIRNTTELWFVGGGEQYQQMQDYVNEHQLEKSIIFHGFKNQSELPDYFRACDVFILPSEKEPFGLIINEVMNQGKAIITTNEVGAARDLVNDGENGWVINAGSEEALHKALNDALKCSPEQLKSMGKASLEKISSWNYDADIAALRSALAAICR